MDGPAFCIGMLLVVAASVELFTGNKPSVMARAQGAIRSDAVLRNIVAVVIGNVIGGSVLVGLVYYLIYIRPPRG